MLTLPLFTSLATKEPENTYRFERTIEGHAHRPAHHTHGSMVFVWCERSIYFRFLFALLRSCLVFFLRWRRCLG